MLALSNLSIRKQILLGFFPVLLILAAIAIVSYQSFRSFSETFDDLSTITDETQLFLQIDEDMTELQRNVLVYSYVGYSGILSKIERLQRELEEKLDAVRPITKNNNDILDRYTRLLGHYDDYKKAFAEAVRKRKELSEIKKEEWGALLDEGMEILKFFRVNLEQQNYQGRYLKLRLKLALVQIDTNKRAFESSPDAELVKDTHRLLNEMEHDANALKSLLPNTNYQTKIDRLLALLPEYRETFMKIINLNRVYMHLTNVVLAGKAAEIDKLSKELNALATEHSSSIKQAIESNINSSQRDYLALVIIAAIIGIACAWGVARSLSRPVQSIAETLFALTLGKEDTKIVGLDRRDEVGQMAKAASAFKEMGLQLADSRSRLAATLENMNDGLITINQQGIIESFNAACEGIFGYSAEEVIGKNIKVLMPEPYHSQHDGYLKHYARTGEQNIIGVGREVEAQRKDGTTFPIELSVAEFKIGSERRFSGVIRDIAERKEAEDNLRQQNSYMQLTEKIAGVGHWYVDLRKNDIMWSDEIYHIHGVTPDSYQPDLTSAIAFYHPDDRPAVEAAINKAIAAGENFEFELRLLRADGEVRHVHSRGECRLNEAGEVEGIFGVFHDITERKKAETLIKDKSDFQELIFANSPTYLFVKDRNFVIIEANQRFLELYPEEERDHVLGAYSAEGYSEEDAKEFLKYDQQAFDEGYSAVTETIHFPNGKTKTLYTQKVRFEDSAGKEFILGIAFDVTDREELIDKLTDSNEELERFAYVCSHDLQEPLRMIRSFSSKLQSHIGDSLANDEKGQKYFQFITDGAARAQALINDILSYSSIDSDTRPLESVDINVIIETVKTNMALRLEESDGSITANDMPVIRGHKTQLYQLFQNLINNALKYQPPHNKPYVHVGVKELPDMWEFYVRDNGIGMEERHLKKIFDVFQRLHRKDEYAGTGVGLSICKKVVQRHGGSIRAESEKGKGSTFYFTIAKSSNRENNHES